MPIFQPDKPSGMLGSQYIAEHQIDCVAVGPINPFRQYGSDARRRH